MIFQGNPSLIPPACFACHCDCLICVLIIGDSLDSNLIILPDWDSGTAMAHIMSVMRD